MVTGDAAAPFVEISIEAAFLVNRPDALGPGRRELLVTGIIAQLDATQARRQSVLLTVDCRGGSLTAGIDLWAALKGFRASGLHAVVEIVGQASSAAAIGILGASYILLWPWSLVGLHGPRKPAVVPSTVPDVKSPTLQVLVERAADGRGVRSESLLRTLLEQWSLGGPDEIAAWTGDRMVDLDAEEAVRWGFGDEIVWPGHGGHAREVALARVFRGEVRSPRLAALAALGRGDARTG